ncbi:MAG: metal-dependent hydrolase [Candidatus Kariarchaeaceae archaeon]|jgi:hypothetical protein
MYLFGHVGFFIFANFLFERMRGEFSKRSKLILGFGAIFPDLIDKPIGSLLFQNGRWLGHSLFVLSLLAILSYLLTMHFEITALKDKIHLIYIGSLAHLILDLPYLSYKVAFWPFFGDFPTGTREGFLKGFSSFRIIITEVLGLLLLVTIGVAEKWNKKGWYGLLALIISYAGLFLAFYGILIGF